MGAWVYSTDFVVPYKATGWFVYFVESDQPDKPNKPDEPELLGLAGGLRLFSFEFCPAVIEPLRGYAGCIQRCRSFL